METVEMTAEEATRKLAICALVVLEKWPLEDLLSFNLAVLLNGRIPRENRAFERARDAVLCQEDGTLWDREALEMAIGAEMKRRELI